MLIEILIALAAIVVLFVAVVAMQPSSFRVARTTTIGAPAPAVFAQVNDFHHWEAWSPWAKLDPAMRKAYGGAPAGVGAISTWAGNAEVGEGLKPFAATSTAEFTFKPEGDRTVVTWSLAGENDFKAKAVHLCTIASAASERSEG